MVALKKIEQDGGNTSDSAIFDLIANDLIETGLSIHHNALPHTLANDLWWHVKGMEASAFARAGIGREREHQINGFVRSDEICWITGETHATAAWLGWCSKLQIHLNRRLFLGLFSFESHFAHYAPGKFYKRHVDAFKGQANRVLTVVAYLNPAWGPNDGGELVVYGDEADLVGQKITPAFGTLAVFLSEQFPHEVLPAQRDRYSIAGWFRLNTSNTVKVDPPR